MTDPNNRIPLIAGNWKMNTTPKEGHALATAILEGISAKDVGFSATRCDIGFYPPATSLAFISDLCSEFDGCKVYVGAQLSLIHIPSPRDGLLSRMPSSA